MKIEVSGKEITTEDYKQLLRDGNYGEGIVNIHPEMAHILNTLLNRLTYDGLTDNISKDKGECSIKVSYPISNTVYNRYEEVFYNKGLLTPILNMPTEEINKVSRAVIGKYVDYMEIKIGRERYSTMEDYMSGVETLTNKYLTILLYPYEYNKLIEEQSIVAKEFKEEVIRRLLLREVIESKGFGIKDDRYNYYINRVKCMELTNYNRIYLEWN